MKRRISALVLLILVSLIFAGCGESMPEETEEQELPEEPAVTERADFGIFAGSLGTTEEVRRWNDCLTLSEDGVYTFFQGPRAWNEGYAWGGEWCDFVVKGRSFGGFGCGLVCMANIYSSLSPYECSPLDMFDFATQVTGYYPTRKSGAIDWGCMKEGLKQAGFACDLFYKPDTYEEFQEHMSQVDTAIVLVSSVEDDAFWQDTPGHYVNIWLYDEKTDCVFLAEPGDLDRNRTWIPLRYVYDALKTSSAYQYLAVWDYDEEKNTWKRDGIDDNWNQP